RGGDAAAGAERRRRLRLGRASRPVRALRPGARRGQRRAAPCGRPRRPLRTPVRADGADALWALGRVGAPPGGAGRSALQPVWQPDRAAVRGAGRASVYAGAAPSYGHSSGAGGGGGWGAGSGRGGVRTRRGTGMSLRLPARFRAAADRVGWVAFGGLGLADCLLRGGRRPRFEPRRVRRILVIRLDLLG